MTENVLNTRLLKQLRQVRQFNGDRVPDEIVHDLLEVARWTGSAHNAQPWHFIVVTNPGQLAALSTIRTANSWLGQAPLSIAILLDGPDDTWNTYDEGRVTERLLIAGHIHGLAGGTAWFVGHKQQDQAKEVLGVPSAFTLRSLVVLGYPSLPDSSRSDAGKPARKPLRELVSYGTYTSRINGKKNYS